MIRSRPKLLQCQLCDASESLGRSLYKHYKEKHKGHPCKLCLSFFDTEEKLKQHDEERKDNYGLLDRETIVCAKCPKRFGSTCDIQRHMLRHLRCQCEKCGISFTNQYQLDMHHVVHNDGKGYPCTTCGQVFENKPAKKRHMQIEHKPHRLCGVCGVLIRTSFHDHMRSHKGVRSFKCRVTGCGKSFYKQQLLKLHLAIHTVNKPYPCGIGNCKYRFSRTSALTAHRKTHSEVKRYKCHFENCDRAFHQRFDLDLHLRRHTGEKPFDCSGCGFYTRSLLRKHLQSCNLVNTESAANETETNVETEGW